MKIIETRLLLFGEGLCLNQWIFVKKGLSERARAYTIAHECCHALQFKTYGVFKFILLYFIELFRNGYYNNKFEIEAREYGRKHYARYMTFTDEQIEKFKKACCWEDDVT